MHCWCPKGEMTIEYIGPLMRLKERATTLFRVYLNVISMFVFGCARGHPLMFLRFRIVQNESDMGKCVLRGGAFRVGLSHWSWCCGRMVL